MFSSQKVLWVVFVVLFLTVASELFYIFYYQPFIAKKNTPSIFVPTISVKASAATAVVGLGNVVGLPFIFNEKSASNNGQQVEDFISEAKKTGRNFVSFNNFLKEVMKDTTNCNTQNNCFQSYNLEKEGWKNDTDADFPISISGPFLVKLNFYGSKDLAGVFLRGRTSKNKNVWWEGIIETFIGIGDGGRRLYADTKNNSKDPVILFDTTFDKKIEGVYILFNEKGTSFLVTDLAFNKIAYIEVNKITDNKFPEGLFPDKQSYIGYAIAPLSDLKIYDFLIL